ncbi:MAG: phospho-N-acetylmuramoyl-pentapeptide-transferase [Chloroflexota bacterium]|nr:phospho-N-acetylmuramoyl-pentapeptide-transferase [Chloroflexota bacterium]
MTGALLSGGIAFLVALTLGSPSIRLLRALKFGKAISGYLPESHQLKSGTPTMGGLFIWATVLIVTVLTNLFDVENSRLLINRESMILPISVITGMLVLGVWDDFGTFVNRPMTGLTWRLKFASISLVAGIVAYCMFFLLEAESVNIPWIGKYGLGYGYLAIAFVTVFTTTTAVSVTDGLDGLLGGTAAFAFGAYAVIAFIQGQVFLAIFCFTVSGALLGFLWYNAHPASVFMGDAGALPLGAALATVALMTGHWLILPIVGIVYVLEAGSALVQVIYFKVTSGKRIFLQTPFHHHLELLGWSEPQIVMRLYLLAIAGAMLGVALALKV